MTAMDDALSEDGWPRVDGHAPWPRCEVDAIGWTTLVHALGRGEGDLVALFADSEGNVVGLHSPH